MRYLLHITVLTVALATSARAADDLEQISHGDLVNACVEALELGQSVDAYAKELISRSRFNLGPENAERGRRCLKGAFGFTYTFEGGRFISREKDADLARQIEEAERRAEKKTAEQERLALLERIEQEKRERRYWLATIEVCRDMYHKDRFVALTNTTCASIFKSQGLPE
ncbi:MAG: hypothetical protein ACU0FH_11650 [Heliomarina sp.]|uniref:hypothetical protein n=1 Tax=Heliomarina sp. TaxID=2917556 RepID=UPI004057FA13